jgi:hypothetical protein
MAASCGALNEERNVRLVRRLVNGGRAESMRHGVDVASKRHGRVF